MFSDCLCVVLCCAQEQLLRLSAQQPTSGALPMHNMDEIPGIATYPSILSLCVYVYFGCHSNAQRARRAVSGGRRE